MGASNGLDSGNCALVIRVLVETKFQPSKTLYVKDCLDKVTIACVAPLVEREKGEPQAYSGFVSESSKPMQVRPHPTPCIWDFEMCFAC